MEANKTEAWLENPSAYPSTKNASANLSANLYQEFNEKKVLNSATEMLNK